MGDTIDHARTGLESNTDFELYDWDEAYNSNK